MENPYIEEQMKKALALLKKEKLDEALAIYEMIDLRSATDIQRAVVYNDIGVTYKRMGLYKEATKKYNEALAIYEKNGCEPVEEYIYTLNNIGVLNVINGNYTLAESLFIKTLNLTEKHSGTKTEIYSVRLNNLAALYLEIGNYKRAELFFIESLKIKKIHKKNSPLQYIRGLNNLAELYRIKKDYLKAIYSYKTAILEMEKINFTNNNHYYRITNNLCLIYLETEDFEKANQILLKSEQHDENNSTHTLTIDYSKYLITKSKWFVKTEKSIDNSIQMLERASEITNQQTGKNTLFYAEILAEKAILYLKIKQIDTAFNLILESISIQNYLFTNTSFQFAEKEALLFLKKINREYNLLLETLLVYFPLDKEKIKNTYMNIILRKSIILEMTMIQNIMLKRYKKEDSNILSEHFKNDYIPKLLNIDYENILNKIDNDSVFMDMYYLDQTDKYIMFVIRPNSPIKMIDLGNGKKMNQLIEDYRRSVVDPDFKNYHQIFSEQIISLFFSIFDNDYPEMLIISPVNELSKLPFETLMTRDGFYLIEKTFIKYISSVKDVVEKNSKKSEKTFSVVSNPDFNYPFETFNIEHPNEFEKTMSFRSIFPEGTHFPSLNGIQQEGRMISDILTKKEWQKKSELSGKDATIPRVKQLKNSTIIHIVTHGFFNETTFNTNPLKDCGFAFTGVNTAINQNESINKELKDEISNGVLTAYDMTFMNLEDTELMILSACKTGLGKIVNGNGVLGFQRAVLLAGVNKMIMTLWDVSDNYSSELMKQFYSEYVVNENAEGALRKAKLYLIDKYYNELGHANPILWGGYVCLSRSF